jgi:hypothetical protein
MNKKLKEICIVFENCDCVTIPQEYVSRVYLDGIVSDIYCQGEDIFDSRYCKKAMLVLNKKSLDIKTNFQENQEDERNSFQYHLENYHDITHVEVVREDEEKDYIGISWEGESEYSNSAEKVRCNDWGWGEENIVIMIGYPTEEPDETRIS